METGNFADRVFIEQFLEALRKTRQIIGLQRREHLAEFRGGVDADIDFTRIERPGRHVIAHGTDDTVAQTGDFLAVGIDTRLQETAHVFFTVVARLHRQLVFAQGFRLQLPQQGKIQLARIRWRGIEQLCAVGQLAQRLILAFAEFGMFGGVTADVLIRFGLRLRQRLKLALQLLQQIGRRFQCLFFTQQLFDRQQQRLPVQLTEMLEHRQLLPVTQAVLMRFDINPQCTDARTMGGDA